MQDSYFPLGLALHAQGQLDAAIGAFAFARERDPAHVEAQLALGHCLLDRERNGEAAALASRLADTHPEDLRVLILKARALLAEGAAQAAVNTLTLVLAADPANAPAHEGLANAFAVQGDAEGAVKHAMIAFRLLPDAPHASNFSSMLILAGHHQEALTLAEYALARQPRHFAALVNRATALDMDGDMHGALASAERAVAVKPASVTGRLLLAGLHLRLGHLTPRAWDLYEARHQRGAQPPAWQCGPVWDGQPIAGTILLQAEQGFGDTLQFVRYAPLVAQRAGRVILSVQPALLRLLRTVPGVDRVISRHDPLPAFDAVCPLLSLPRLFATTLDSIPPPLPYADPLPPTPASGPLRVGLVWAGNPDFQQDTLRSIPPDALSALAGTPDVQFYSLQHQPTAFPPGLDIIDLMADVTDFADTAHRIAGLDLVIAVDTAVAHLAATMGKPVWLLSRHRGCWRWLQDRADSPWYPTLRVLRQPQRGQWAPVLDQLRRDLTALTALA